MEIRKRNNDIEKFAELVRAPKLPENNCICSDILSKPSNQSMILTALANNAHRNSKLAAETGDDFYLQHAEANRELSRQLKKALGLDDYYEDN